METITPETVRHVAKLARIAVTEDEVAAYSKDLTSILEYIDQLNAVDVAGVEPLAQVNGLTNIFREDVVTNKPMREELLKNTPKQKDGFIQVKSVL